VFKVVKTIVKKNPIIFLSIPFFIVLWFLSGDFVVNDEDGAIGIERLSAYNFDQNMQVPKKPVLVDFGASWCGPCRKQTGVLKKFIKKYNDVVAVYKVDVSKDKQLARKYRVDSIPTLILFLDGKELDRAVGFQSETALTKMIERHIKLNESSK